MIYFIYFYLSNACTKNFNLQPKEILLTHRHSVPRSRSSSRSTPRRRIDGCSRSRRTRCAWRIPAKAIDRTARPCLQRSWSRVVEIVAVPRTACPCSRLRRRRSAPIQFSRSPRSWTRSYRVLASWWWSSSWSWSWSWWWWYWWWWCWWWYSWWTWWFSSWVWASRRSRSGTWWCNERRRAACGTPCSAKRKWRYASWIYLLYRLFRRCSNLLIFRMDGLCFATQRCSMDCVIESKADRFLCQWLTVIRRVEKEKKRRRERKKEVGFFLTTNIDRDRY